MDNNNEAKIESPPAPAAAPRYRGLVIDLGGKTYVMPGLNLRQLRVLAPKIDAMQNQATTPTTTEWIGQVLEVVLPALQRNYPTVTADELEDLLDLGNLGDLLRAALGKATPGEVLAGPTLTP
jgi:hypothetical protein